jgi:hypothetical protein
LRSFFSVRRNIPPRQICGAQDESLLNSYSAVRFYKANKRIHRSWILYLLSLVLRTNPTGPITKHYHFEPEALNGTIHRRTRSMRSSRLLRKTPFRC